MLGGVLSAVVEMCSEASETLKKNRTEVSLIPVATAVLVAPEDCPLDLRCSSSRQCSCRVRRVWLGRHRQTGGGH